MLILGITVFSALFGAFVVAEIIGFLDGSAGFPTASQIIKTYKRRYKLVRALLTVFLVAFGPILYMHWILEWF